MHYAYTDAIVAEIADEMDLSSTKAIELLGHVVDTDSVDSLPFLTPEQLGNVEWNEDDELEWGGKDDLIPE